MSQRILIIDDEENIRRVMRLTIAAAGYEVGEASDGPQGLAVFGNGSDWDAVLLDQRMPGMDGLEVLCHIKERDPAARVVMVTAYASIELAVDAMKLGANEFVRKPMTPEILRGALAAVLSKSKQSSASGVTAEGEATSAERPTTPIETITLNGFAIIRPAGEAVIPTLANEHRFLVKSPEGKHYQVIVTIDDQVVSYVERMTRRRLPAQNSFWALRAERLLGDYLWYEGKVPENGRLTLTEIDREALTIAERWDD
jgi:DNA-binding response OmpR family regulator